MVECRTPEREVGGSIPTAAVLCPWARHFTPRKYWLITRWLRPDMTEKLLTVKPQHKQTKHVNAPNLFHSTPRRSRHNIGTAKMRGKLVQRTHWTNEIAVEEHKQMMIKLASDSNSSSDSDTVFGLRAYEMLNSNIWWINRNKKKKDKKKKKKSLYKTKIEHLWK